MIPGLIVLRPADANETAEAWKVIMKLHHQPAALILTCQAVPTIDRSRYGDAAGVARGAYVLADAPGADGAGAPDVVLMSSGSEVALVLEAQRRLAAEGVRARAVSVPSQELFAEQPESYRREVLPAGVPRVAVEAAHPMSWQRWVGESGVVLGISRFGASAPYARIYEELGLTVDKLVDAARGLVGAARA